EAVLHLAAEALIDESIRDPGRFYQANVCGGLNLLDAMVSAGIRRIIFSSTAAVYGEPTSVPIPENADCTPVNAYGESKLAFERSLSWYQRAHGLNYVSLRYFNACGATARVGECHQPETHLIPRLLDVALGRQSEAQLYGTDFDTPDGTCIRDYVHVADIAQAHALALARIDHVHSATVNIGSASGYSNREVIEAVQRVTGRELPVKTMGRRPGDPARLVASSEQARSELGWRPRYTDLASMVRTAWDWRRQNPQGYAR
ncbi:MAG TPA: UDP-glucose 4-epimerase GalE, partial [Chloroflexota bacterium]|nr:UDP-glucose 4-epimerase GalE [Chloroflexota bacterium]